MVKVAFLVPMIAPYRVTFFEKLARMPGIDLCVFHGIKKKEDGRPAYSGEAGFQNSGYEIKSQKKLLYNSLCYRGMFEAVKSFNPDIVVFPDHCATSTYWKIAKWANKKNKKLIIWCCGWQGSHIGRLREIVRNISLKRFLNKADMILAYSTKAKQYAIDRGFPSEKIEVVYNGIDIEDLEQNYGKILKSALEIPKKKITFLYVGGLIPDKRVDLLLEAYSKVESYETELWIIGDGPLREELKKLAKLLNIKNIKFMGRIIDGVDKYFAAADYFVLPGAGGLALNQAMFWNTPCIVSVADGTEEDLAIDGQAGFRFAADDVDSLVGVMKKVIRLNADEYQQICKRGKKIIVTQSNVNEMVKKFNKCFKALA